MPPAGAEPAWQGIMEPRHYEQDTMNRQFFFWHCPRRLVLAILTLAVLTGAGMAAAGTSAAGERQFDNIEVHYSTFNSTFLRPEVAKAYGIERSSRRALLNLAIRKQGKPLHAQLRIIQSNLMGQKKTLKPRLIEEENAIYYLASFAVTEDEVLKFTVRLTPEGETTERQFKFDQRFHED